MCFKSDISKAALLRFLHGCPRRLLNVDLAFSRCAGWREKGGTLVRFFHRLADWAYTESMAIWSRSISVVWIIAIVVAQVNA
jgi:hypothetical protein